MAITDDLRILYDINTEGRSDDAPWDDIASVLGSNNNSPTTYTGDGGYTGLSYVAASSMSSQFNSGSDYTFPDPGGDGLWTIAARFRSAMTGTGTFASFGYTVDSGTVILIQLQTTNARMFVRNDADTTAQIFSGSTYNDDVEHVCCVTYNGTTYSMTVDGGDTQTVGGTSHAFTIDEGAIGATITGAAAFSEFFDGEVFWAAAWSRVLSGAEIDELDATPNPFHALTSGVLLRGVQKGLVRSPLINGGLLG